VEVEEDEVVELSGSVVVGVSDEVVVELSLEVVTGLSDDVVEGLSDSVVDELGSVLELSDEVGVGVVEAEVVEDGTWHSSSGGHTSWSHFVQR
jgi:hypothetical protein